MAVDYVIGVNCSKKKPHILSIVLLKVVLVCGSVGLFNTFDCFVLFLLLVCLFVWFFFILGRGGCKIHVDCWYFGVHGETINFALNSMNGKYHLQNEYKMYCVKWQNNWENSVVDLFSFLICQESYFRFSSSTQFHMKLSEVLIINS